MIKKYQIYVNILMLIALNGCNSGSTDQNNEANGQIGNTYLAKPNGQYGVGFKDMLFIDKSRCPDVFYEPGINESDYSSLNINHCREIVTRVYYPANIKITANSPYYYPQILDNENLFTELATYIDPSLNLNFSNLEATKSYTTQNAEMVNSKFPAVLFSPGSGSSAQDYENIITNITSHGYVTIGINSLFLSGYIALPNGHITTFESSDSPTYTQRVMDIEYVYNHINEINHNIANIIDTNKIAMMGHSDGANGIAQILSTAGNQYPVNAAIAMDTDVKPSYESFNIPFMHMLSGSRYWTGKYGVPSGRINYTPQYQLAQNNYLVGLTPTVDALINPPQYGPLYTTHGSFTNDETLQFLNVYQIMQPVFESANKIIFDGNTLGPEWGVENGWEVNSQLNIYVLAFLDAYIKGIPNKVFNTSNCATLTLNTIISCGPDIFPNK